jgi:hypothetical protein
MDVLAPRTLCLSASVVRTGAETQVSIHCVPAIVRARGHAVHVGAQALDLVASCGPQHDPSLDPGRYSLYSFCVQSISFGPGSGRR